VGGASDPSVERLVELHPDLVIVWEEGEAAALALRVEALGIAARRVRTESLHDLRAIVDSLGVWLGRERAAAALRRTLDSTFAAVRARVAGRPPIPVMYLVWDDPPVVAGADSYADALLELAGGANVFGDVDDAWPEVSVEAIVQRDPRVIVWPREHPGGDGLARLARAPGWRDLAAVRGGRVYLVPANQFNRLGPGVAAAADTLARLLHP
jgi:iron complex transport system substrate-binding protein